MCARLTTVLFVPEDGSTDDLAEARRRGSELQAGLPASRWNSKQLRRADIWVLVVLPLAILWIFVLANRNTLAVEGAVIGSVTLLPLMWLNIKDVFRRGTRW
jgi:hypothetical protein